MANKSPTRLPSKPWQRLLLGVTAVFLCAARPAPDGYELMLGGGTGGFSFRDGGCSKPIYRYDVEQRAVNGQARVNDNGWLHEVEGNVARSRIVKTTLEGVPKNSSSSGKRPDPPRYSVGDVDYAGNVAYRFGHAWSHASISGGLALIIPRKDHDDDRGAQPFVSISAAVYAGVTGPYMVADLLSGPIVVNEVPISAGFGYRWPAVDIEARLQATREGGGFSLHALYNAGKQLSVMGAGYYSGDTDEFYGTVGLIWRPEAGPAPPAEPAKSYDGWPPGDD